MSPYCIQQFELSCCFALSLLDLGSSTPSFKLSSVDNSQWTRQRLASAVLKGPLGKARQVGIAASSGAWSRDVLGQSNEACSMTDEALQASG